MNNCLCFYSLEEMVSYVEVTTGARKLDTNYTSFIFNSQTNGKRNGKVTLVMIKNVFLAQMAERVTQDRKVPGSILIWIP